ncbi:Uncharacterised protein [uncultured archaeon]|nr:Uncharacterised protein [uncultured archaeon]
MSPETNPTGLALVGIFYICLVAGLAAAEQQLPPYESQNRFKDIEFEHFSPGHDLKMGTLDLGTGVISFPWASRKIVASEHHASDSTPLTLFSSASLQTETVQMNNTNSKEEVKDLIATNAIRERSLVYSDSQNKDPHSQKRLNDENITVARKEDSRVVSDDVKTRLESILSQKLEIESCYNRNDDPNQASTGRELKSAGNYLNVDVHGITVSALNTVEGGNAVATSNIIIKPVQIIICAPEVEAKLK